MLAHAKLINAPIENYITSEHPVQINIIKTFSEICNVKLDEIAIGIDGCSAPVFGIPLRKAAYGYARLCDPRDLTQQKASASQIITDAMMSHPDMVAGPGRFDTRLMEVTRGKIVSKGGAEGFHQIGIMPNVIKPGTPGIGIAIKISDGDFRNRARPAVTLEILYKLRAISNKELDQLSEFGPRFSVENWRKIIVGEAYPVLSI
jgi:L-asparaginase II